MVLTVLSVTALLLGGADLAAIALGRAHWRYLTKAGAVLAIIGVAASGGWGAAPAPGTGLGTGVNLGLSYGWLVLAGLICSLAGDIFLVLPGRHLFLPGLLAFLVAHLWYLSAFPGPWTLAGGRLLAAVLIAVTGPLYLNLLRPGVVAQGGGGLLWAVAPYMVVLSLMLWRAVFSGDPRLLLGGLLFFLSDATLGWVRFVRPSRAGDLLVMGSYLTAQYLIALSVALPL